jgi:hypothetical protein
MDKHEANMRILQLLIVNAPKRIKAAAFIFFKSQCHIVIYVINNFGHLFTNIVKYSKNVKI